jgi:hypothetical protein
MKKPYFHSAGINRDSCIRAAKLITANEALILEGAGRPVVDTAPIYSRVLALKPLGVMILMAR